MIQAPGCVKLPTQLLRYESYASKTRLEFWLMSETLMIESHCCWVEEFLGVVFSLPRILLVYCKVDYIFSQSLYKMHGLRRSFTALAPRAARLNKPNVVGILSRNMVTLDQKELGEEAAYFRKQEHDIAMARKAKMDAILAREDSDHHKQALLNLVGKYIIKF